MEVARTITVEVENKARDGIRDSSRKNGENLVNVMSGKMVIGACLDSALSLNFQGSAGGKRSTKYATVPYFHVFKARIPKHLVSLDEKYIQHCLKVIHFSSVKAASCDISARLDSSFMGFLKDGLCADNLKYRTKGDLVSSISSCSLVGRSRAIDLSPVDHSIVGSIMNSESMANIMKSPLFHRFNDLDCDANLQDHDIEMSRTSLGNESTFPGRFSACSSENIESDVSMPLSYDLGYETKHTRFTSTSSTFSLSSEPSSSSSSSCCYSSPSFGTVSQGMLHCTWNGGIPHFVFSLDDERELYIADPVKVGTSNFLPHECVYLLYSKMQGKKEIVSHQKETQLVGKMKVSRAALLDESNSRIIETEFVLYGGCGNHDGEVARQTSSNILRKSRVLSKKVVEAFKSGHFSKQRSLSRFAGGSSISEIHSAELCQDVFDPVTYGDELLGDYLPFNLQLTAIVTKDHVREQKQVKTGGWGLKFLKNNNVKPELCLPNTTQPSESCHPDPDSCSTSMDVIIPAGIHGGPRTLVGGPSSLLERWRSGGRCDCDGWDLGCPLRVLKTKSDKRENYPLAKEFDLYLEGSEHNLPILRMTNVHDGLHLVHFRSNLSALQCFSIAVAYIHRHTYSLES